MQGLTLHWLQVELVISPRSPSPAMRPAEAARGYASRLRERQVHVGRSLLMEVEKVLQVRGGCSQHESVVSRVSEMQAGL